MVDEMIPDPKRKASDYNMVVLQVETMAKLGFSQPEIDQARKPEGLFHNGCIYKTADQLLP